MTQTIAVGGLKGGSGKTSIALHLARDLSTARCKVVLIDLDPQQSTTEWAAARDDDLPPLPFTVESIDASRGPGRFRELFDRFTEGVDLAIFDCPPELQQTAQIAFLLADLVLIPCTPSAFDLRAAAAAVELARDARKVGPKKGLPLVSLVPSRLIARTRIAADLPTALRTLGESVAPAIGQRVAVAESSITGRLVPAGSPAGREFAALARHVKRRLNDAEK